MLRRDTRQSTRCPKNKAVLQHRRHKHTHKRTTTSTIFHKTLITKTTPTTDSINADTTQSDVDTTQSDTDKTTTTTTSSETPTQTTATVDPPPIRIRRTLFPAGSIRSYQPVNGEYDLKLDSSQYTSLLGSYDTNNRTNIEHMIKEPLYSTKKQQSRLSKMNQMDAGSLFKINDTQDSHDVGTNLSPYVSASWLSKRLEEKLPNLVIINTNWQVVQDTSTTSLYQLYLSSHIPTAAYFDQERCAVSTSLKPHALGPPELWLKGMGKMGITPDSNIVVYDWHGSLAASRFYWICLAMGFSPSRIRILKGGWNEWIADDVYPIQESIDPVPVVPSYPQGPPPYTRFLTDYHDVLAISQRYNQLFSIYPLYQADPSIEAELAALPLIIDTRSAARYTSGVGESWITGEYLRQGHVTGSLNVPYSEWLRLTDSPDGQIRGTYLKSPEQLMSMLSSHAKIDWYAQKHRRIIVMSGTGMTAATACMGLLSAGFTNVSLYDGSWWEYIACLSHEESMGSYTIGSSLLKDYYQYIHDSRQDNKLQM